MAWKEDRCPVSQSPSSADEKKAQAVFMVADGGRVVYEGDLKACDFGTHFTG